MVNRADACTQAVENLSRTTWQAALSAQPTEMQTAVKLDAVAECQKAAVMGRTVADSVATVGATLDELPDGTDLSTLDFLTTAVAAAVNLGRLIAGRTPAPLPAPAPVRPAPPAGGATTVDSWTAANAVWNNALFEDTSATVLNNSDFAAILNYAAANVRGLGGPFATGCGGGDCGAVRAKLIQVIDNINESGAAVPDGVRPNLEGIAGSLGMTLAGGPGGDGTPAPAPRIASTSAYRGLLGRRERDSTMLDDGWSLSLGVPLQISASPLYFEVDDAKTTGGNSLRASSDWDPVMHSGYGGEIGGGGVKVPIMPELRLAFPTMDTGGGLIIIDAGIGAFMTKQAVRTPSNGRDGLGFYQYDVPMSVRVNYVPPIPANDFGLKFFAGVVGGPQILDGEAGQKVDVNGPIRYKFENQTTGFVGMEVGVEAILASGWLGIYFKVQPTWTYFREKYENDDGSLVVPNHDVFVRRAVGDSETDGDWSYGSLFQFGINVYVF